MSPCSATRSRAGRGSKLKSAPRRITAVRADQRSRGQNRSICGFNLIRTVPRCGQALRLFFVICAPRSALATSPARQTSCVYCPQTLFVGRQIDMTFSAVAMNSTVLRLRAAVAGHVRNSQSLQYSPAGWIQTIAANFFAGKFLAFENERSQTAKRAKRRTARSGRTAAHDRDIECFHRH